LGVAIAGTIVGTQAAVGASFADASHAFWWCMVGAGVMVVVLGLVSCSGWARVTAQRAAHLLQDPSPAEAGKRVPVARFAE
jgi:threonine/homoserine/homoserine lactone efflux protein